MLIATMQNMQSLNPLQMRRAVKDYRFEVNEPRMSEECSQYLSQLQRDWERRRIRLGVEAIQRQVNMRKQNANMEGPLEPEHLEGDPGTSIDSLFDPDVGLSEYVPPSAPPSIGELEDSRYMLPLVLPSNQFLPAIPPSDAAYRNIMPQTPFAGDVEGTRPRSRMSYSSNRPLGWSIRRFVKLRELPDGFVSWLQHTQEAADHRLRLHRNRGIHGAWREKATHEQESKPEAGGLKLSAGVLPLKLSPAMPMGESTLANVPSQVGAEVHRTRVQSDPSGQQSPLPGPSLPTSKSDRYPHSPRLPLSAPPHFRQRTDSISSRKSLGRDDNSPVAPSAGRWWRPTARVPTNASASGSDDPGMSDDGKTPTMAGAKRFWGD
jgi:hypothetical protein